MTTSDSDRMLEEYLSGQSKVSRVYGQTASDGPPAHLDRAVLDTARAAGRPRHAWSPFASHWYVPASLAAVLVLVVGIFMFTGDFRTRPDLVEPSAPAEEKVAALPPAERADGVAPGKKSEMASGQLADAPAPPPAAAVGDEREASRIAAAEQPKAAAPMAATREMRSAEVAKRKEPAVLGAAGASGAVADIVSVKVSGSPGAYDFDVGVRSKETGCRQYADWWEVVSEDGKLLYRRVLLHSHVDEQPFSRSGGPVAIQAHTVVWVRAHMNPGGYGGVAYKGSPQSGFGAAPLPADFAAGLGKAPPLPDGCAF